MTDDKPNAVASNALLAEPTFVQKLAEYYKAGAEHRMPEWIPSKIVISREVRGDMIFASTRVGPGVHECTCNGWGAISVKAENGKMLGIKWDECEIVELTANASIDARTSQATNHRSEETP